MVSLSPLGFRAARRGIPEAQKKAFPDFLDANPAEVTLLENPQIFPHFQIFKCTALNRSQANVHMDLVSGSEGLPGSRNATLQTLDRGGPHEARMIREKGTGHIAALGNFCRALSVGA